jgi:hypothetical protein
MASSMISRFAAAQQKDMPEMLNRTDTEYENRPQTSLQGMQGQQATCGGASREMTVGELIDQRIYKAERLLKSLHDLKGSLSQSFLSCGASRISALLDQ